MPTPLHLISPTVAHRPLWDPYLADWAGSGEILVPYAVRAAHGDYDRFLRLCADASDGMNIPEGSVPSTA